MQSHTRAGGFAVAGFFVPHALWADLSYAQKEDVIVSWIKSVRSPEGFNGSGGVALDSEWMQQYPALHDYITLGTNPDGTLRRTSTITLFADMGTWKCYLNERDSGASLCATGSSVSDTLAALEVMLEAEVTPWRFSDRPRQENGKKSRRGS
jgi:hypothetical protein